MGFLDNYEDVNARIKRFRTEFPSGRLIAFIEDIDIIKGTILVKAEAYREYEDTVPSAVDYAFGNVSTYPNNTEYLTSTDRAHRARHHCARSIITMLPASLYLSRPSLS